MKKIVKAFMILFVLSFCGCATAPDDTQYQSMAKENDFSYFFPGHKFVKSFATVEEAYDYVRAAQIKFASSSGKAKAKGLAAKLNGPQLSGEQPVVVFCTVEAGGRDGYLDLSTSEKPLESSVRNAVSTIVFFWVFYEDRAVSIPGYYLQTGYAYTSGNQQQKSFSINNNTYSAEYPVNWNAAKAFSYLRKEIN